MNHPYGHGKIEFLSSGLEGSLIIIAGLAIIYKSGYDIFFPHELKKLDTGIVLIIFAGIINGIMGEFLIIQGKKTHSIAMEANGKHLRSDAISTLGILIGLIIIHFSGTFWLDNAFAIFFGIIIIFTGIKIIRNSIAGIMDEADLKIIDQLVVYLNSKRKNSWIDIHNFRVIKFGPVLHVDCHMTIPWYYTVKHGHSIIDEVEATTNELLDRSIEFFIHLDPCEPNSCSICSLKDCPKRMHPFQKQITWTSKTLMANRRHGISKRGTKLEQA